ncbi:unnamed protein product [Dibothriocephalus latus]|uniref:Reverse transcriptase domain-containing protein n=1 Tax=Dibothriocephalus latus TaxID=60516 RepID=A0A3P7LXD1_DIBLA|nr:unnamed protein product [Dibothriocephalus latus]
MVLRQYQHRLDPSIPDCGVSPHDCQYLFACSSRPGTQPIPVDLWLKPAEFGFRRAFLIQQWATNKPTLHEKDGVEFASGRRQTDIDYAGDIALLASSFGDLQSAVSRVNEIAMSVGLTKSFSSCIPDQEKAHLGGLMTVNLKKNFKYLGARLLPNGQSKDYIISRIDAVRRVFFLFRKHASI